MPQSTYQKIVEAALALDRSDTHGSFRLADAVLAHVPATSHGGPGRGNQHVPKVPADAFGIPEQLDELAERLTADGVVTPKGDAYTSSYLRELRKQAMSWAPSERHPEAAFRTHREASSDAKRDLLAALCAVARGESVKRPSVKNTAGVELVTAESWAAAKSRIKKRTSGFEVNANDLRVTLQRPTNNTGGSRTSKLTDVQAVLEEHGAEALAEILTEEQITELAEVLEEKSYQTKMAAIDRSLNYIEWLGELAKAYQRVQMAIRHHEAAIAGEGRNADNEAAGEQARADIQRLLEADADLSRGITDADLASLLEGGHK